MKNVGRAAREGRTSEVLADTVKRQQRSADEQDRRWREQVARQSASITRMVEFLQERELMDEYNAWASKKEQSNG